MLALACHRSHLGIALITAFGHKYSGIMLWSKPEGQQGAQLKDVNLSRIGVYKSRRDRTVVSNLSSTALLFPVYKP